MKRTNGYPNDELTPELSTVTPQHPKMEGTRVWHLWREQSGAAAGSGVSFDDIGPDMELSPGLQILCLILKYDQTRHWLETRRVASGLERRVAAENDR